MVRFSKPFTPAKGRAAPCGLADRTIGNGKPEGFPHGAPMNSLDAMRPCSRIALYEATFSKFLENAPDVGTNAKYLAKGPVRPDASGKKLPNVPKETPRAREAQGAAAIRLWFCGLLKPRALLKRLPVLCLELPRPCAKTVLGILTPRPPVLQSTPSHRRNATLIPSARASCDQENGRREACCKSSFCRGS